MDDKKTYGRVALPRGALPYSPTFPSVRALGEAPDAAAALSGCGRTRSGWRAGRGRNPGARRRGKVGDGEVREGGWDEGGGGSRAVRGCRRINRRKTGREKG
jgi:hypothetical protein